MNGQQINQGGIYWLNPADPETGIAHPHVVIRVDAETVMVCALTSNISRVSMPGNLLLDAGEGGLPRQSVVEVSKNLVVDKTQLGGYIGTLSEDRVKQIWAGMRFVQTTFFPHASPPCP